MVLLWVLGVLLGLLMLLCLLRVGAVIDYDETLTVRVSAGPFRFQVLPAKAPEKKKKSEKEPEKQPEENRKDDKAKKKISFPKPDFTDIKSAVSDLWPPLKRALNRTRRGIRVDPLEISAVLGGRDDPAKAAEYYGYANAVVWSAMPALEQLLDIPNPHIHIGLDFEQSRDRYRARAGVTIRVGTLLLVGLQLGIPALKWYLRFQKRHKQAETPTEPAEKRPAA